MTGLRNGFADAGALREDVARALRSSSTPSPVQRPSEPEESVSEMSEVDGAAHGQSPEARTVGRDSLHVTASHHETSAADELPDHGPHAPRTPTNGLVELHESIATLLASRGQWRQAYHHLRSALDLMSADDTPKVPEQNLRYEVARLRKEHAEAREQSLRDSLTASYNRRYLDERLASLFSVDPESEPTDGVGVALVDIDWFKQVNDTYGHVLGDRVLQRVVEVLQEILPTGAFCARYGGEEFVLVLPAADSCTAVAVCETARARIERFPWPQMAPGLRVTVSIGLTHETDVSDAESPTAAAEEQLFSADVLLYAAKKSGRNAVAYRTGNEVRVAGFAPDQQIASRRRLATDRD